MSKSSKINKNISNNLQVIHSGTPLSEQQIKTLDIMAEIISKHILNLAK